jgi:SAM-dependent methyltransferase
MTSVANLFSRFFRGRSTSHDPLAPSSPTERVPRRSSGFAEFMRRVSDTSGLSILDLGSTSAANISFLTNLGHKVYNEDVLVASVDAEFSRKGEDGKPTVDVNAFLKHSLVYEPEQFDAVLCWDVPDYLNESVVKPVIERVHRIMRPGGVMLAFFHTRDAGPDAPCYRYHITSPEMLQLQPVWKAGSDHRHHKGPRQPMFRLQRVFNNRHIENLFHDYASLKFFLARDNVREVLVVR